MLNLRLYSILEDLSFLFPEAVFAIVFVLMVLLDLSFRKYFHKILPFILCMILMASLVFSVSQVGLMPKLLLSGTLLLDGKVNYFKMLFDFATLILILYRFIKSNEGKIHEFYSEVEFYCVLWATLLGLHFLAMSNSMLTAYLSLEMVSIGGYLLATFGKSRRSAEAAIKYLLFGAVSSAIMLYGMSILFGLSGKLNFQEIFHLHGNIAVIAIVMLVAGVLFKIAASPFHLWAPDVYEGVPAPIAAFFSIAPKAGGFILLINILAEMDIATPEGKILSNFLALVAIVTILVGNFSALWQNNAKRLLAYSSIAHTGFALGAIAMLSAAGVQASLYYLGVYLFMNFAAFLMVDFLSESIGSEDVNKFKGLGMQVPLLGVIFVLIMIALTGLPPTAGFYAKFFVFSAMWESYNLSSNSIFLVLLIFGLLNTVISLFYYLKIPYLLFFKTSESGIKINSTTTSSVFFTLIAVPLLVLFIKPGLLLEYINFCLHK